MLITPFPRLTGKKVVRDGRESNDLSEESPPVTLFKLSFMTPPRSQGVACLSPLTQFCFHLYFPAVCVPFSLAFMYKLLLWKEQQKLALCSDCLTQLYLLALWNFWVSRVSVYLEYDTMNRQNPVFHPIFLSVLLRFYERES